MRPLPPFKVKPVRTLTVRRVISAETIRDLAGHEPTGIKPARGAMRIQPPLRKSSLKVLGRADNDQK